MSLCYKRHSILVQGHVDMVRLFTFCFVVLNNPLHGTTPQIKDGFPISLMPLRPEIDRHVKLFSNRL